MNERKLEAKEIIDMNMNNLNKDKDVFVYNEIFKNKKIRLKGYVVGMPIFQIQKDGKTISVFEMKVTSCEDSKFQNVEISDVYSYNEIASCHYQKIEKNSYIEVEGIAEILMTTTIKEKGKKKINYFNQKLILTAESINIIKG